MHGFVISAWIERFMAEFIGPSRVSSLAGLDTKEWLSTLGILFVSEHFA